LRRLQGKIAVHCLSCLAVVIRPVRHVSGLGACATG
jgi:hypothetical protein